MIAILCSRFFVQPEIAHLMVQSLRISAAHAAQ